MKTRLIYNPRSGSAGRLQSFLERLDAGHRCELCATKHPDDIRRCSREAIDEGFDRLIVAGGDGTLNQVVNAIAPDFDAIEIAILPFGTGNDLARAVGILADDIDALCQPVFEAPAVPVDIGRIANGDHCSYFVNVANGGLGGRVAIDIAAEDKRRWGPMAYWLTSVTQLIDMQVFEVELHLDDERLSIDSAYGIAIANGRFVGGGFAIAPDAWLDDGLLDVTIVPALPSIELMAAGLEFTLGGEPDRQRIHSHRARRIRVRSTPDLPFSVDGEATRHIDARFEVVPAALRLVPGPSPSALLGRDKAR